MTDSKITPDAGVSGMGVQPVALIVDGPRRTVTNDFRGRSKSELVDGYVEIEIIDGPPRGREIEQSVLGVLADVITHRGFDKPGLDRGIDANGEDGVLIFSNGDRLVVQIVSVPVDSDYWKKVSKGNSSLRLSIGDAASWLIRAIQKKLVIAQADRANIVLALDIRHCAQLANKQVVDVFSSKFGDPGIYGFAQIWLVGPTSGRCWKIA